MSTIQSRFGEIEYEPQNVVTFPEGLIGFEDLRQFIVMPNKKEGLLFWIQSIEDPDVALVLTDPTNFFLTYKVVPEEEECAKLGIDADDPCYSLVVVTVTPEREVTFNLMAPILFSPKNNRAVQVILEKSEYGTREPLPKIEEVAETAS